MFDPKKKCRILYQNSSNPLHYQDNAPCTSEEAQMIPGEARGADKIEFYGLTSCDSSHVLGNI